MGGGGVYLNYLNIPGVQLFGNIKNKNTTWGALVSSGFHSKK